MNSHQFPVIENFWKVIHFDIIQSISQIYQKYYRTIPFMSYFNYMFVDYYLYNFH